MKYATDQESIRVSVRDLSPISTEACYRSHKTTGSSFLGALLHLPDKHCPLAISGVVAEQDVKKKPLHQQN